MSNLIPKLKKSLKDFAKSEQGKISKQSLVAMGVFAGTAGFAMLKAAKDVKATNVSSQISSDTVTGQHTHY